MPSSTRIQIIFHAISASVRAGQPIRLYAVLIESATNLPVRGVTLQVRMQRLDSASGSIPGDWTITLSEDWPGRYSGSLPAPSQPGQYRLGLEGVHQDEILHAEAIVQVETAPDATKPTLRGWPEKPTGGAAAEPTAKGPVIYRDAGGPPPGLTPKDPLTPAPPGPGVPGGQTPPIPPTPEIPRFLKAEFTEHAPNLPLPLGQEATLALYIDTELLEKEIGARFDPGGLAFSEGEQSIRLHVKLSSKDFIVHTQEAQVLRLPRQGKSRNKVRFDIEPRAAGQGEVTAVLYKNNNFLQGAVLRINVAQGEKAIASLESLGRPLDNMGMLQPRDVLLFIRSAGAGFQLTLVGPVTADAFLPMTPQELNQIIFNARKALLDTVYLAVNPGGIYVHQRGQAVTSNMRLPFQSDLEIPFDIGETAKKKLAEAGWMLYQDLFYGPRAGADVKLLGDRLRQLAEGNSLKLQIVSQEWFVPWGLLYLDSDYPDRPEVERFLGLKHIIEHIPLQANMAVQSNQIASQPRLSVSINIDPSLDRPGYPLVQKQLDWWKPMRDGQKADVQVRQSGVEFIEALRQEKIPDQILYFYGHAIVPQFNDPAGPDAASLSFAGRARVTLRDLRLKAAASKPFSGQPLVFINACESAELSPLFYGGFMPYFTAKGARGMIGAECEVPALFAAEWARRFFERFLCEEKPLGQIMLELRREFYGNYNNLLGLLYALYCDGDTIVTPGLA